MRNAIGEPGFRRWAPQSPGEPTSILVLLWPHPDALCFQVTIIISSRYQKNRRVPRNSRRREMKWNEKKKKGAQMLGGWNEASKLTIGVNLDTRIYIEIVVHVRVLFGLSVHAYCEVEQWWESLGKGFIHVFVSNVVDSDMWLEHYFECVVSKIA